MRTKTITYTRAKALTPSTLIEVQPSFSAQPENSHVRGDYSDTLLAIYARRPIAFRFVEVSWCARRQRF